ncbi:MAG TPA: restriction endonuclease subunit S [Candidatus Obscuribacterales bacterium]
MKYSRVPWIGEIPKHWKIIRLKYCLLSKRGALKSGPFGSHLTSSEMNGNCIKVYNQRTVIDQDFKAGENYINEEKFLELKSFQVETGDILVTTRGTIGRTAIVPNDAENGILHPCLIRIQVDENVIARKLLALMIEKSSFVASQLAYLSNATTIDVIYSDNLKEIFLPVAPLIEQEELLDFLDRKTAAIDALIAKEQRLIELLEEKRSALINQAVTKGLNPNVPMKHSGIPWIGEIPEDWDIKRLKFTCRLETGHTPSRTEESYWVPEECIIPWVSLNDTKTLAKSDYISETKYKISPLGMANSSAHLIEAGAVVFTRDATIGLAAITTKPMAVSQHIIAWVCLPKMENRYLLYVLYSMVQELNSLTMGSTLKTIGMADVKELKTPVPPLAEQIEIANYIAKNRKKIEKILFKVKTQIEKLQEYRQSLITAAVTGKLDITQEEAA